MRRLVPADGCQLRWFESAGDGDPVRTALEHAPSMEVASDAGGVTLLVALREAGVVVGLLELWRDSEAFDARERAIVEGVGAQVSLALAAQRGRIGGASTRTRES